jgi:hypothetical protein
MGSIIELYRQSEECQPQLPEIRLWGYAFEIVATPDWVDKLMQKREELEA